MHSRAKRGVPAVYTDRASCHQAALGFRILEPFLHAEWAHQDGVTPFHAGSFQAFDAILTGLVMGGGADGMHKLVSVFTNLMESAAARAKSRG